MTKRKNNKIVEFMNVQNLRYNPLPPPLKRRREFSQGPIEAFLKADILSRYADEIIDLEMARRTLLYARHTILPKQRYSREVLGLLEHIYDEAIGILDRLRQTIRVKNWLLSHGPPRKIKRLGGFLMES